MCGASGVRRSATPDCWSFRTCGWGPLPTGCGCGVRAWGPGCPCHLFPCRGSSFVVRASRVCGTRWPLWLGTCPRAVVVAGGVPLLLASWPRVGALRLVWSGCSRCSGRLSCRRGAFPQPGGGGPRHYWVAARGTWRPAKIRAHCACRWSLPRQGRWACSALYPFGAPRWGCPWRVPPALVFGCVPCGGSACVDPVTDASGFPYRPSFEGGLGRCTGAVSCGRRHLPFRVGGRHARVPRMCVCVLLLAGSGGLASWARFDAPHLFLWPFLVRSLFARPPPGLGCPVCGCCWVLSFFFLFHLLCPCCLRRSVCSGPGCLGPGRLAVLPSPPFFLPFFPLLWRPLVSCVCWFPARGAVGLGALWSSSLLFFPPPLPPPPFFLFFSFFLFFPLLFPLLPFFFPCPGVPVLRFSGRFVCPGLLGVLVCVAVSLGAP